MTNDQRTNTLICPYCGHEVDDYADLADLGLVDDGEVTYTFNCERCGGLMRVTSVPAYVIAAAPVRERRNNDG